MKCYPYFFNKSYNNKNSNKEEINNQLRAFKQCGCNKRNS